MDEKKRAIMLADSRPALLGQMLIQLRHTNPNTFDEVIIFDVGLSRRDMELMETVMPCRFIAYESPISAELLKNDRFQCFSLIMFARYEMFRLLEEYSLIMWMDTDVVLQGDLRPLLDETEGWGFSILREDPENKSAKNVDYMRTNFFHAVSQYRMNSYLCCTGMIIVHDCLEQSCDYTEWCYQKTLEWADNLNLPDQGVINALIQNFKINVKPIGHRGKYACYPYVGRDCSQAVTVHSWGSNKFWNDWYLNQMFPAWGNCYQEWLQMGGCTLMRATLPAVSVVIPVYKPDLGYFRQCIDSLYTQERNSFEAFSNFEVIIISEPFLQHEIMELIESYHDPRLQVYFNEERLGIAASLNRGLRLAKGTYIARLDDDDIAAPTRLQKQVAYMEEHPEVSLCTTDYLYFGDMKEGRVAVEGEMARAWSVLTCPFDHPTILFRRDFFVENDLYYDEKRGYVEDWELWQRAFQKGMCVGCIHDILTYHRWHNGSAGQTSRTVEMMREMIQMNFKELGVDVLTEDLPLLSPWSGKVTSTSDYAKLENYFRSAMKQNEKLGIYDSLCLARIFSLRLSEARCGVISELMIYREPEDNEKPNISILEQPNNVIQPSLLRRFLKNLLKPLYQPFRHRYEDRLIDIQNNVWEIGGNIQGSREQVGNMEQTMRRLFDQQSECTITLTRQVEILSEQLKTMTNRQEETEKILSTTMSVLQEKLFEKVFEQSNNRDRSVSELHRHIDFTYRDIMVALEKTGHYLPKADIQLKTKNPIAYESMDHLHPHGTIRDNTRYPRFVEKCEELLSDQEILSFLDLGCSGGGMVLEAALKGHFSMGLEGSDCSQKEQRAEWRLLGERLKTCDITKPFKLVDSDGSIHLFDIITAWEVMEHIEEKDLTQLFQNIMEHLSNHGYFICSIANWEDIDPESGVNWHVTTYPYSWWETQFEKAGFEVCSELLNPADLARGGYNPPHCYETPYPEYDQEKSFHMVARKART